MECGDGVLGQADSGVRLVGGAGDDEADLPVEAVAGEVGVYRAF
jgi:hypothetical protein